jgi:hypothetical protein
MSRHAPSRSRRAAVAAVATLATGLPLAAVSTPGDAAPASAVEKPAKPTKKKPQKYQHRAKVGAQIARAIVLDMTPGVEGGKVVDLRVGRAASQLNTRKQTPAVATSKSLGGKGLADQDLSGLLTAIVAKAGPTKGEQVQPSQTLVPVPAEPLLSLGASTGEATARWGGPKKCVPSSQVGTSSTSSTADLGILPGAIPGTPAAISAPGTASAIESARYTGSGKRAGLKGVATTALADLTLFGAVDVEVVADPKMVATANGRPGGAKITYTPAVLEITDPIGNPVPIPTDGAPAEIGIPANPLLGLTIQTPGIIKQKVTDNGRMAKAKSVALRVVLTLGGQVIADVAVAPLQTKVKVPKGGIACR